MGRQRMIGGPGWWGSLQLLGWDDGSGIQRSWVLGGGRTEWLMGSHSEALLPGRARILTGQDDGYQKPEQQEQQAGQQEDTQPGEVAVWLQPSGTPTCGWDFESPFPWASLTLLSAAGPLSPAPRSPLRWVPCQGARVLRLASSWKTGVEQVGPDSGSNAGLQNSL